MLDRCALAIVKRSVSGEVPLAREKLHVGEQNVLSEPSKESLFHRMQILTCVKMFLFDSSATQLEVLIR